MSKSKKTTIRIMVAGAAVATALVSSALVTAPASAAQARIGTLPAGLELHRGDSIISSSTQYDLAMQTDGNLVEHGNRHVMWASGTNGNRGAYFKMQFDGNAVVYTANGKPLWSTRTNTSGTVSGEVGLGDDGNLWVKRYSTVVWQNKAPGSNYLAGKGATLGPNGYLHSGPAKLVQQTDGNLVSYVNGKAVWSTRTNGQKHVTLTRLMPDGSLNVFTSTDNGDFVTLFATPAAGATAKLELGMDGKLTLFSGTRIVWQS